jgi:hypothetical protein
MATMAPGPQGADESQPVGWLPRLSSRDGELALERGLHQEIGWERHTDVSGMAVMVYSDSIGNPVIEAMGSDAAVEQELSQGALFDRASGLLRAAGPDFSSTGMLATFERRLPGGNHVRLTYANGDALVMPVAPASASPVQLIAGAHPRHAQMYALALSGTLEGTGTRWRASYRWQPDDTVTQVAAFAKDAAEPYLNLHVRQPIHLSRDGSGGFEALVDLTNLLAEGYRPYLLNDGSLLIFAQDQRGFRAGLAFTF